MGKKLDIGAVKAIPIYSQVEKNVSITASNISSYFTVTNSGYYFVGSGSTFTSNNKGVNTSTAQTQLKAKYAMTISFTYSYSSESNYDKFSLTVNGTAVETDVSGSTTTKTYSGTVPKDGVIVFKYTKDGSTHSNDDKCTFSNMTVKYTATEQTGTENKSVASKVKKAWIGDTSGKARKIKKMWIGDANGKARLFFSGNSVKCIKDNVILYYGDTDTSSSTTGFQMVLAPVDASGNVSSTVTTLRYKYNTYDDLPSSSISRLSKNGKILFTSDPAYYSNSTTTKVYAYNDSTTKYELFDEHNFGADADTIEARSSTVSYSNNKYVMSVNGDRMVCFVKQTLSGNQQYVYGLLYDITDSGVQFVKNLTGFRSGLPGFYNTGTDNSIYTNISASYDLSIISVGCENKNSGIHDGLRLLRVNEDNTFSSIWFTSNTYPVTCHYLTTDGKYLIFSTDYDVKPSVYYINGNNVTKIGTLNNCYYGSSTTYAFYNPKTKIYMAPSGTTSDVYVMYKLSDTSVTYLGQYNFSSGIQSLKQIKDFNSTWSYAVVNVEDSTSSGWESIRFYVYALSTDSNGLITGATRKKYFEELDDTGCGAIILENAKWEDIGD